jgi:hypothetical protein
MAQSKRVKRSRKKCDSLVWLKRNLSKIMSELRDEIIDIFQRCGIVVKNQIIGFISIDHQ